MSEETGTINQLVNFTKIQNSESQASGGCFHTAVQIGFPPTISLEVLAQLFGIVAGTVGERAIYS